MVANSPVTYFRCHDGWETRLTLPQDWRTRLVVANFPVTSNMTGWLGDEANAASRLENETGVWLGDKVDVASGLEDNTRDGQLFSNISQISGWLGDKADATSRMEGETIGGQLTSDTSKISAWMGDEADATSRLEDNTSGGQLSSNIYKMTGWLGDKADAALRLEDETSGGQFSSSIYKMSRCKIASGFDISTKWSIYQLGIKLVNNYVVNIYTINQLKYIDRLVYIYQC